MYENGHTSLPRVHRFILLTDIASSSRLAEQFPREYMAALRQHNKLVEDVTNRLGGQLYKQVGDGYFVLFESAGACLQAAAELGADFSTIDPIAGQEAVRVRIALHAGSLQPTGDEYFGPALNRISRICQACIPGQVLLSGALAVLVGNEDGSIPVAVMPDAPELCAGLKLYDLGQHHLRDLAEPEQLYQLDSERFERHEFPPLATLNNRPNNLVEQPNAFIGREQELTELESMLMRKTRLVSIIAPGGYGKSRLAVQLCANMLHRYENGVFMVHLAPVREGVDVSTAIANALGYQFTAGRTPEQQLCDYLKAKDLLLCLDNFEHLQESSTLVAELLGAAPRLNVIVTSREPLRIQGESTYRLEPLGMSSGASEYSDAQLLFADRAALVKHGYSLTSQNASAVRRLCEHLSGIPLAIELAAAWMDSFTLEELHDELSSRLELESRMSDKPQRHQSLQACLDWSWQLLGPDQQTALMKLSVFRDGFFSDAAGVVLGAKGMGLRSSLARLADKSWLNVREVNNQTRFFLRDLLTHEYAFARLKETSGITDSPYDQAVGAHASHFSALVAREGPNLDGGGSADEGAAQRTALTMWRTELDNILKVLDSGVERGDVDSLAPITRHLPDYFDHVGNFYSERDHMQDLLESAVVQGNDRLRIPCLQGLATAQFRLGRYDEASDLHEQALALCRELDDKEGEARNLSSLGAIEQFRGNHSKARELYDAALALCAHTCDRSTEARVYNNLGNLEIHRSNYDAARDNFDKALERYHAIGDRSKAALCLYNRSNVEVRVGNYDRARELFEQTLVLNRELGQRSGEAYSLYGIGQLEIRRGSESSNQYSDQALALFRDLGDLRGECICRLTLGNAQRKHGDHDNARESLTHALQLSRELGNRSLEITGLIALGQMETLAGRTSESQELVVDALKLGRDLGNKAAIAVTCMCAGDILAAVGHYESGATAVYGGQLCAEQIGYRIDSTDKQVMDSAVARLAAAIAAGSCTEEDLSAARANAESKELNDLVEAVLAAMQNLQQGGSGAA